ncbi:MAG: sugar ABC transporter permease YjfF [Spirochaetia bacterium]|jgi:simple sugar transport system permease protein|nr:sugar ABC transporter permease YjfF [Spirochaetia bacterium]
MKLKKHFDSKTVLLWITILLFFSMYIIGMVIYHDRGFANLQNFLNLFISNAGLIVISAGMTVVMITGGIDISVGSFVAMACMILADLMENKGLDASTAIFFVLIVGIVFGFVQGWFISYLKIQPFIMTLAGMFFARGMTAIISQDMINIQNKTFLAIASHKIYLPFGGYLNKHGKLILPYIYPTVIVALIALVIIFWMLRYTKLGRNIYAIGGNEQSAMLMGLDIKKTKLIAYTISGLCSGIGGTLFCLNTCSGFVEQAKGFEMDAIASAVIGGTLLTGGVGNVFGTLFGVLINGTIQSFITFQGTLSSWWVRISIAALLAFFIILQSIFAFITERRKGL